jgi:hypothetical protein
MAGPSLPVLPPPAPRLSSGPPKPATPAEFFAASASPTVAPKPTKRRGRALRGFAGFIVVCGLAAGAYVGATRYLEKSRDAKLPTFSAPAPTYQSATIHIFGREDGTSYDVQVVTDANRSVMHLTGAAGSDVLGSSEIITDGQTAFVNVAGAGWTHVAYDAAGLGAYADLAASLRVFTYDDLVPESIRPYVTLLDETPDHVGTREVTKYEFAVRMRDFEAADAKEYDAWSQRVAAVRDVPALARFVFWIDSSGVVWQEQSYSDDHTTNVTSTLIQYANDPPAIVYPTEYTDVVTPPSG